MIFISIFICLFCFVYLLFFFSVGFFSVVVFFFVVFLLIVLPAVAKQNERIQIFCLNLHFESTATPLTTLFPSTQFLSLPSSKFVNLKPSSRAAKTG